MTSFTRPKHRRNLFRKDSWYVSTGPMWTAGWRSVGNASNTMIVYCCRLENGENKNTEQQVGTCTRTLMGGLLHLVQRGGDLAGPSPPRPLLAVPNVTARPTHQRPVYQSLSCFFNMTIWLTTFSAKIIFAVLTVHPSMRVQTILICLVVFLSQ